MYVYASKLILLHSICFNLNSLCSEPELYSVWMIFVETELTVKVIPRYNRLVYINRMTQCTV